MLGTVKKTWTSSQILYVCTWQQRSLLEEVTRLVTFTDELRKMAADVANIAEQTNLLALNAA